MNEKLVGDVVDFFYKDLRNKMSSMQYTHISVEQLGIFRSRPKAIKARITKLQAILSKINPETMRGMKIIQDLQGKIDKLNKNLALWDKEFERKQQVKEKRYGIISSDMAKQSEDNRGDEEQSLQEESC